MDNKPYYDVHDCIALVKKKYPLIPKGVIRRVLHANDLYLRRIGVINWLPELKDWK